MRQGEYDAELERLFKEDRSRISWAALNLSRAIEDGVMVLREIAGDLHKIAQDVAGIRAILSPSSSRLTKIKLVFGDTMAQGPVTLSSGQSTTARLLYFDQTGAPMPATFVPPNVAYTIDHPEFASSTPGADLQSDVIAYVAAGVANLTASVTSAEGLALSDTETVTCSPIVVPPPVLSSVKIDFSTPTP